MKKKQKKGAEVRVCNQLENLIERYPILAPIKDKIWNSYETLLTSVENGGKILVCGNGGSSADSDHIVGELMKSFCAKRPIDINLQEKIRNINQEFGEKLANNLEDAIPAISLSQHTALSTACANDKDATLIFAQQIIGYGEEADTLIAISTSGNSLNAVLAAITAKAKGLKVIALTGAKESRLTNLSDICINVPETETYKIQELHLPIYHALCLMLETSFWDELL